MQSTVFALELSIIWMSKAELSFLSRGWRRKKICVNSIDLFHSVARRNTIFTTLRSSSVPEGLLSIMKQPSTTIKYNLCPHCYLVYIWHWLKYQCRFKYEKATVRSKTERFSGYHRHLVSQNFLPLPSLTLNHFVETLDLLPHISFFKWYFGFPRLKFDEARHNFSKLVSHRKLIKIRWYEYVITRA